MHIIWLITHIVIVYRTWTKFAVIKNSSINKNIKYISFRKYDSKEKKLWLLGYPAFLGRFKYRLKSQLIWPFRQAEMLCLKYCYQCAKHQWLKLPTIIINNIFATFIYEHNGSRKCFIFRKSNLELDKWRNPIWRKSASWKGFLALAINAVAL